jgi:hypothetical protein
VEAQGMDDYGVAGKVPGFDKLFFFTTSPMSEKSEKVDAPNIAPHFFLGPYDGLAGDVSMICHLSWCKGNLDL